MGGAHPTSSSIPTCTHTSAPLASLMKLGRASRKCGSSSPFTSAVTSTRSPPTRRVRSARSGTVATTFSLLRSPPVPRSSPLWAKAVPTAASNPSINTINRIATSNLALDVRLSNPLVRVRRVRPEQHLQPHVHRVRLPAAQVVRPVVVVLHPDPRELRQVPHQQ